MIAVRVRCAKLKPKTGGEYRGIYQKLMGWEPRIGFHLLGNLFYRQPYFRRVSEGRERLFDELGRSRIFSCDFAFHRFYVHLFFYSATCVWSSASNYEGKRIWAILAKASVVLGTLKVGLEIIQMLQEIPGLSPIGLFG